MNDDRQAGSEKIAAEIVEKAHVGGLFNDTYCKHLIVQALRGGGEWTALRELKAKWLELADSAECYAEEAKRHSYPPEKIESHARTARTLKKCVAELEALAAAVPAPPAKWKVELLSAKGNWSDAVSPHFDTREAAQDRANELAVQSGLGVKFRVVAIPPQDGQGAELLGPPRGGSGSDLAVPSNLNVGRAPKVGWVDSMAFDHELSYRPTNKIHATEKDCRAAHPCIEVCEEIQRESYTCRAMRVYVFDADAYDATKPNPTPATGPAEAVAGNASAPVGERVKKVLLDIADTLNGGEYKGVITHAILPAVMRVIAGQPSGVGEPRGIPKIPDAPDTRHASAEFERGVMSRLDWTDALHATYFALFKKQAPESMKPCEISHAIVDFAAREVGEGLREGAIMLLPVIVQQYVEPEHRGVRVRIISKRHYSPTFWVNASDLLAAPAPKHDATLADYCERCKAGQLREYRTVVMPEPYGGTGWWHWSPDAVWPNSTEKGAWFTCQVQSVAPKPAPPAEPDARFEAHTKAVADFLDELYAIMVDPLPDGSIKVAEMQRALLEAAKRDREYSHFINYYNVEATARLALERWRMKPHNAKWWKKIDGTPIPNDLIVCISEDIAVALRRAAERKPPR